MFVAAIIIGRQCTYECKKNFFRFRDHLSRSPVKGNAATHVVFGILAPQPAKKKGFTFDDPIRLCVALHCTFIHNITLVLLYISRVR